MSREQGMQPQRLRVCLPAYDDIDPMTVHSLFELNKVAPFSLDMIGVADVAVSRTMLVDRIDPSEFSHVLWVDADMVFAPQHFFMLLEALDNNPQMGLVSGLAVRRDGSNLPCVNWRKGKKDWDTMDEVIRKVMMYTEEESCKSVDVTGLAFTLMHTEVFTKLKKPYFQPKWIENTSDVEKRDFLFFGEDSSLVKQMKAKGYDPSVHFGVHVGHIGKKVYVPRPPNRVLEEQAKHGTKQPDASDSNEDEVRDGSEVSSG